MNREAVEDFFYHEAALLDAWDLDGWMDLLCDDARYLVPPNDVPDGNPDTTLFIIADDMDRIRGRVKRLKSRDAHAEFPPSRTRRLITNVRILEQGDAELTVTANFRFTVSAAAARAANMSAITYTSCGSRATVSASPNAVPFLMPRNWAGLARSALSSDAGW